MKILWRNHIKKRISLSIIVSIIYGSAITLITGFFTHKILIGATWFGYPLHWLVRMVVSPEYFPYKIVWLNFIIDIIIWSVIVFIILVVIFRKDFLKKEGKN